MLSAISRGEFHPADLDEYAMRVITSPRDNISDIRFMGDGLSGYISNVLDDLRTGDTSFEALSSKLATKHFTMPRIYRALTMMILGIRGNDVNPDPQYIRVLGFDHDGRYCLKIMGKCAKLPIIHNHSDFLEHSGLSGTASLSLKADDLSGLMMGIGPGSSREIPPVTVR
jgi:predicted nucleotidyltransferase